MVRDTERPTLRRRIARWRRSMAPREQPSNVADIIRESGLFDPDWYLERYPDVAEAGLDPLEHYAAHGGAEGRKAGPRFDGRWYTDHYPDVAASGLHPLVHYVTHGQGRQTVKRVGLPGVKTVEADFHDAEELLASPLFDAAWYSTRQDLKVKPEQAALHYLKVGALAGYAPSPKFDGAAYWSAYTDVRHSGVNPLLHFIRYGDAEGRRFTPSRSGPIEARPLPARRRTEALPAPVTDVVWRNATNLKPRKGRSLVETFGAAIGTVVEVFDGTTAPLPESLRQALRSFATLGRLSLADETTAKGTRGHRILSGDSLAETRPCPVLVDAWFVNDATIRLRLDPAPHDRVSRIYQGDSRGKLQLAGEALVHHETMTLVDARVFSPLLPIVLVHCTTDGDVLGGGILPFPSLLRGGLHAAELEASGSGVSNTVRRERLEGRLLRDAEQDAGLQRIEIDITGAHGAERIFSRPVLEWLNWLGVEVQAGTTNTDPASQHLTDILAADGGPARPRGDGQTLFLSAKCLPTISALFGSECTPGIGGLLVADAGQPTPRWMVSPPANRADLDDAQPIGMPFAFPRISGVMEKSGSRRPGLLGVLFHGPERVTDSELAFPVAPDTTAPLLKRGLTKRQRSKLSICAIVCVRPSIDPVSILQSLARQTLADSVRVILAVEADDVSVPGLRLELERWFPDRHELVTVTFDDDSRSHPVTQAMRATDEADMLLLCHPRIDLHDTRTLETLYALADRKNVATVGCLIVREAGFKDGRLLQAQSAGIYPSHVSLLGAPLLTFQAPETTGSLPLGTYSVVGNDPGLIMVPRRVWDRLGGISIPTSEDPFSIDFSLRALSEGFIHLCTTAVSVTNLEEKSTGVGDDIPAIGEMNLPDLAKLLDSTTIVRALS